jgi:hypothetical protein
MQGKIYIGNNLVLPYMGDTYVIYNDSTDIVKDSAVVLLDTTNTSSYPGSGNTWTDLSGNGNNANVSAWASYWNSNGYFLLPGNQGVNAVGIVTHNTSLNIFSGAYTLMIVGSIDYIAPILNEDFTGAFVKADSWVNNPGWGVAFNRNEFDGRYQLAPTWRINNTINQGTSTRAWTLGEYFVIHLVYDEGIRTIYDSDNNIVAQGTLATYTANNTSNLFLGRASSLSNQYYGWAGKYVSAGIYSKALSADERAQNITYFKSKLGF